ncbi:hypothetical protein MLD38_038355 [Melastoma candidum]|uniref:Uncharacterized protein n=1 Tax=Melastoma candidum TaxID=119954 RepID=A0ACB9KZC4_9MYRT|nr:hypothetical protein MLD38_038355 [Melastoma candidum]
MADPPPNPSTPYFPSGQTPGSGLSSQLSNPGLQQSQIPAGVFPALVKLDDSNYVLWKGQILAAIIASGFEDFIFGNTSPPAQFLDDSSVLLNPDYKQWHRTDKAVMSLLFSSLTTEPLSLVVCCKYSSEVWETLRNRYESASPSRILNLRLQMQQLRKNGRTMQQYLNCLKSLSDQLSAIGEPMRYRDYLWYLMEGLPAEYDAIVTAIYSRTDQPQLEEVHNLLLNFDMRLERRCVSDSTLPQPSLSQHPSVSGSESWLMDTGATHHATPNASDLHNISTYTGSTASGSLHPSNSSPITPSSSDAPQH